jgi:hypothetical protein
MDTIVNPFKQASMGIVKGVSSFPSNVVRGVTKLGDGLTSVSDSVVENAGKIFRTNSNNNNNRINIHLTRDMQTFPIIEEPQVEVKKQNLLLRGEYWTICIVECEKYSTSCSTCDYG